MKKLFILFFICSMVLTGNLFASGAQETGTESSEKVTITIESWRSEDLAIWEDTLIPAFNKHYPDIEVLFAPTPPADYNSALNAKLEAGTAGDLITARPFDSSLILFQHGSIASLNDLDGMDNFSSVAKSAWITDDGSDVFAVPMASVIHGFIYNDDIFKELGLSEPETEADFFSILEKIKTDGRYVPLAIGTADLWDVATMGFHNIGPNYWMGETGRTNLISGKEKFSDDQYVAVWETLSKWAPYMSEGFEAQSYPDSQNLFTLGKAAIYPAGSWEIGGFNEQADFAMGAFPPPVRKKGDTLYISDHTDIALGMNSATKNPEASKTFLTWMTTKEFAELYSNALPGFFSLGNFDLTLDDALASEMIGWRQIAETSIRNSYQILGRGEPNLENELWVNTAKVINGTMTAEEAGETVQNGLDRWYKP